MLKNPLAPARATLILSVALLLAAPPLRADTAPPTLLVLEHLEQGRKIQTPVAAIPGPMTSPLNGKLLNKISVLPGTVLALPMQPMDVLVELYRGAMVGGELLCAIKIRYFPNKDGKYAPTYQLYREPAVVRGPGGRWIPIESACSTPTSTTVNAPLPANGEGFYPSFEFGLMNGPLQIDSWVVR